MQNSNVTTVSGAVSAGNLKITGLHASQISANSIAVDKMYGKDYLLRLIRTEVQAYRQDTAEVDAETPDDEYEAGYAEGYDTGVLDGMAILLDRLSKL